MTGGGKLKVKVVNGRNLQNKETFQTSDPYCKLEIGGVSHKTKHVSSNLNPDWNEEFVFDVKPKDGMGVVALSVWDKNTIKKDAFMGYSFVTIDDCKKDQDTEKKALMLGDCKGEINLVLRPDFETSATKIEKMYIQIKQVTDDELKTKLQDNVKKLGKEKENLTKENKSLQEQLEKLQGNKKSGDEEKNGLSSENESLKKEIEELKKSNSRLSENDGKLNDEINNLKKQVEELKTAEETVIVSQVDEQFSAPPDETSTCKRDDIHKRLVVENEKLLNFKADLLQELLGFQTVQELIFIKLNEQMRTLHSDKNKAEEAKEELRQQIMGFEKVQELIFNQFNGKVSGLDLSLLKQIVEDVRTMSEESLDNAVPFVLS